MESKLQPLFIDSYNRAENRLKHHLKILSFNSKFTEEILNNHKKFASRSLPKVSLAAGFCCNEICKQQKKMAAGLNGYANYFCIDCLYEKILYQYKNQQFDKMINIKFLNAKNPPLTSDLYHSVISIKIENQDIYLNDQKIEYQWQYQEKPEPNGIFSISVYQLNVLVHKFFVNSAKLIIIHIKSLHLIRSKKNTKSFKA